MKYAAVAGFRCKLAADEPVLGLWITLEAPSVTEQAVAVGMDWVVIDAEHGHMDWRDIVGHIRATVRSDTLCLVRVSQLDQGLIKRALDIGADGVVVPWMESAQQAREALHWGSFPPEGRRGIGAERATVWGRALAPHVRECQEQPPLIVPLIESVEGGRQAGAIAAVPGIDLCFFGPADWSATTGHPGTWEGGDVATQILSALGAVRAAGCHAGIVTTGPGDLRMRRDQGFRMLCVGLDAGMLIGAMERRLVDAGRLPLPGTALAASPEPDELHCLPPALAADRPPVLCRPNESPHIVLDDRVNVINLIGGHCGSAGLTIAAVQFEPGGSLVCHHHPVTESVVVLTGGIATACSGQEATLPAGASVALPAGAPHRTANASDTDEAWIHVAMPCARITRDLDADADAADDGGYGPLSLCADTAEEQVPHTCPQPGLSVRTLAPADSWTDALVHEVDGALYVARGRVQCRTGSQCIDVPAGCGLFLPRGTAYSLRGEDDARVIRTLAASSPRRWRVAETMLVAAPSPVPV
ncbi:MAG: aldolase/citrate lyase family protein [Planctomycetota bacterium]